MLRRTPDAIDSRPRGRRTCSADHRARPLLAALVLAALHLALPGRAGATVVKALTLEEKCQIAPLIIHGVVERAESSWEVPEARIQTLITVRVLETLKGEAKADSHLIVYQGGGKIGELEQRASGMSSFEPGEEVVLFLEPMGPYVIELGIGIGKYAIAPSGREKWVTHAPDVAGARYVKDKPVQIEPIQPMEPMPLAKFLKLVRSHVAGIPVEIASPRKGARLHPAPVDRPIPSSSR